MRVPERLQEHAVDDAEDGGDGADPEREGEGGDDQETRLFAQAANRVPQVG